MPVCLYMQTTFNYNESMTSLPAPILFAVDADGIATLTLNRPERFNAFTAEMVCLWRSALENVIATPFIRVLVLTGQGKAFCSGGDMDELESFLAMDALQKKDYLWENVHQIPLLLERVHCPVIAAVNGTARGAGLDMALMCDIRVISDDALVAESYIRLGLMPGDGGAWFLPRLVGISKALELLWTGDEIGAEEALRIGLVNRIAPAGEALNVAMDMARKIARQPQQALRFTKRAVYDNMNGCMTLRAHLDSVSSHMAVLEDLPEFRAKVDEFRNRKRVAK